MLSNNIRRVIFRTPRPGMAIAIWKVRRRESGDLRKSAAYRHAIPGLLPCAPFVGTTLGGHSDGRRLSKSITRITGSSHQDIGDHKLPGLGHRHNRCRDSQRHARVVKRDPAKNGRFNVLLLALRAEELGVTFASTPFPLASHSAYRRAKRSIH